MGANFGKGAEKHYLSNLARSNPNFDKKQIVLLHKEFEKLAARQGNSATITREEFGEALNIFGIAEDDDKTLDRAFNCFDGGKDKQINFKELISGVSILLGSDLDEKIALSFELFDVDGQKLIKRNEMIEVLSGMNSVASFFGEGTLSKEQIEAMVEKAFEGQAGGLDKETYYKAIQNSPEVVEWLRPAASADSK